MSSNIEYSIKNTTENSLVVRASINSFNVDHVTDKDIVSFYRNFSSYALFDTGLMPLNGSGVLAIRSAGNHTQITFQHEPQINHINWGQSEGDLNAKTYTVAQPYRIWIGDLVDGNLLGARMFYSPYPITSPEQPLYHLNLPNTNCKGYRGTGVGWQCLYHNADWTNLPFNEKIVRFAERCSGVETYNDANMSETDGPRFYRENNFPLHVWDPIAWQEKTSVDGLNWVLDSSQWMPIFVKDQDNQDRHYYDSAESPNAVPLTIQMAMLGNYKAYYHDENMPKPVNIFSRSDLNFDSNKITNWLARSHHSSTLIDKPVDSFELSKELRLKDFFKTPTSSAFPLGGQDIDDNSEDENQYVTLICPITGNNCDVHESEIFNDSESNNYCESCFSENVVYCENVDNYYNTSNQSVLFIDNECIYIHKDYAVTESCPNCGTLHWENTYPTMVTETFDIHVVNAFERLQKKVFLDSNIGKICITCSLPTNGIKSISNLSIEQPF
ncbi:hypothetical protein [Flavobacterium sp.]|uniref:hypothetical protein n=1 Tax=Flavobacterium sp. TaxID=239 RepID=UPI003BC6B4AE